ncbi:MAG: DEAD/DEAH box helicase, partial [Alphaproteobacteria bacterium]
MTDLRGLLREHDALRDEDDGDKVIEGYLDRQEPEYRNLDSLGDLHSGILKALEEDPYGGRLYKHQCEAIEKALSGENIVLESPTASGKTLSFMVPMFDALLKDRKAHALLIYPMKALSRDQRSQINKFAQAVGASHIESWPFDGDTDKEHRRPLKLHPPRIVITNPDTLHFSFLAWREQWEKFLINLRYVVIDEMHEYRGFFGSNIALLMRRFRHMLDLMD